MGEASDREIRHGASPGRLSAVDIHDAGPGGRGRLSLLCLPSDEAGRAHWQPQCRPIAQGHGLRAACGAARALAG